jgi:hypothetical protein
MSYVKQIRENKYRLNQPAFWLGRRLKWRVRYSTFKVERVTDGFVLMLQKLELL